MIRNTAVLAMLVFLSAGSAWAQTARDTTVELSATGTNAPASITLNWTALSGAVKATSVTVARKAPGATSWGSATALATNAVSYVDSTVSAGTAYEFKLKRVRSDGITAYGYIAAGIDLPAVHQRGTPVVLVDAVLAPLVASYFGDWGYSPRKWQCTIVRATRSTSRSRSTTTEVPDLIIKADALGRLRVTAERRESLLDVFERSGLSGPKFSELLGLKYQTFATWVQKRRQRRGPDAVGPVKSADPVRWLEAVVEQAQGSAGVGVLHLPGGARMELRDAKQVEVAAMLLRALAKSC